MKNWILAILALIITDLAIVDSDGDRTKSLVIVTYSNGLQDKMVVDKSQFNDPNNRDKIVEAALKMIDARNGK